MRCSRLFHFTMYAGLLLLGGCDGFFIKPTPTPPGNSGNFVYVGNSSGTIAGFTVSTTGGLTGINGLPFQATTAAVNSLVVSASNAFMYTGTANGIFLMNINSSTGALTVGNGGNSLVSGLIPTSLQGESTGKLLLAGGINGNTAPSVGSFSINTDGTLAAVTAPLGVPNVGLNSTSSNAPAQIAVTPSDSFVYLAIGNSGVAVYSFNTSGALATTNLILRPGTSGGVTNQDTSVAIDPTGRYLYVGETNAGLRAFTIGTDGSLTPIAGSPYKVGGQPKAIAFDSTAGYLYVLNAGSGTGSNTVSAFSVSNGGALTALNPATIATGSSPSSLTLDQSKKFMLVANSGGTPDLQLYSFDATTGGKLDPGATAATGPNSPAGASVVVSTH